MKYDKLPFSIDQHIELLQARGLEISDIDRAKKYLCNIGYFHLTGYMYPVQAKDGSHTFHEGITFGEIIDHYQFDKKLRVLIFDYLERIEVTLRAKLVDKYSLSRLLNAINPANSFLQKLSDLIETYSIKTQYMGFPDDWKINAAWAPKE